MPVGLGKAIGKAIIDHLNGDLWDESQYPDFKYSRYKNVNDKDLFGNQLQLPLD